MLANAIKFTKSRKTAVSSWVGGSRLKENIYYIKDTGAEFEERYISHLFRPFRLLQGGKE